MEPHLVGTFYRSRRILRASGPHLRDRDTLRGYRGTTSRRSTRRTGDGCPSGCPRPRAQSHLHAVCTPSLRVHAARLRRPPAPPARAAHSRRPLAPPACVRHAVLLVLRRYGDDARDVSTKASTASATAVPSSNERRKRRRSNQAGPAHAARRVAFMTAKEHGAADAT